LKDVIIMRAMTALDFAPQELIAPETFVILKDLEAYSEPEDDAVEEIDIRSKLQNFLNTSKHDVDLSEIDFNGSREEILDHFAELLADADARQESKQQESPKKSKKQLIKEQKEEELASLQKQGLSSVYKQLAKTLHPDLEQNQEVKAEKEVLMKKLTSAYKNNDLHSILTLEIEWMEKSGNAETKTSSDEQLKVYNSILKDQVADLERTLHELRYDPKYAPIAQYCQDPYMPPKNVMALSLKKLKSETKFNTETVNALLSAQAEHVLNAILDSYATFY
ncbi:MAG: hypothetical protein LLF94_05985, partial [Chlamydiales bacterium]|nr:hypothetical protein [Chlamydiales bacterium]